MYKEHEHTAEEDRAETAIQTAETDLTVGNASVIDHLSSDERDELVTAIFAAYLSSGSTLNDRTIKAACVLDDYFLTAALHLAGSRA